MQGVHGAPPPSRGCQRHAPAARRRAARQCLPTACLPRPLLPSLQLQKLQSSISGRQAHSFTTTPSTATYASSKLNKS